MPGTGNPRPSVGPRESRAGDRFDPELAVFAAIKRGRLHELLEIACEEALLYADADPGWDPHPGVRIAVEAYRSWKRTQGGVMSQDARDPRAAPAPETIDLPEPEFARLRREVVNELAKRGFRPDPTGENRIPSSEIMKAAARVVLLHRIRAAARRRYEEQAGQPLGRMLDILDGLRDRLRRVADHG